MKTYRPIGARIVAYGVAVITVVVSFVIGAAMPSNIVFTGGQIVTLLLILAAVLAALHGIGRSFVRADENGLDICNGYKRHQIPWTDVRALVMKKGAPWPTVVLNGSDERHVILFAIQGSDGNVASRAVAELATHLS